MMRQISTREKNVLEGCEPCTVNSTTLHTAYVKLFKHKTNSFLQKKKKQNKQYHTFLISA